MMVTPGLAAMAAASPCRQESPRCRLRLLIIGGAAAFSLVACASGKVGTGSWQFERQFANRSYAYAAAIAPDGTPAERFELRPGDCPRVTGDCSADRERVELVEALPASPLGREFWYHYSLYVPSDFPATGPVNTKLGQFHQRGGGKPPVLFTLNDTVYFFELSDPSIHHSDPMNPDPPLMQVDLLPASEMKGRWTDVLVNARWSQEPDGFIKVWINGAQKIDHSGPNADRGDPVNFKYGIYRSFVSRYQGQPYPTLVAYYREVRKGSTRESVTRPQ